jgi:hypothetical protein
MAGVFQNIDPPHPLTPRRVCTPRFFGAGGGHTRWLERGVGVNILEDVRHSSVLYVCKYFVAEKLAATKAKFIQMEAEGEGYIKCCSLVYLDNFMLICLLSNSKPPIIFFNTKDRVKKK